MSKETSPFLENWGDVPPEKKLGHNYRDVATSQLTQSGVKSG